MRIKTVGILVGRQTFLPKTPPKLIIIQHNACKPLKSGGLTLDHNPQVATGTETRHHRRAAKDAENAWVLERLLYTRRTQCNLENQVTRWTSCVVETPASRAGKRNAPPPRRARRLGVDLLRTDYGLWTLFQPLPP